MDRLIHTVAKESVYKELEKAGLDPNDFQVTTYEKEGLYDTFHGSIFYLSLTGPKEIGSYNVLITPGEEFPEAGEAQVKLSIEKINNDEVDS